ncbi:hypothetical protein ACVVI9_003979 [Escherichia coli]|uniref:Uncharacterized protein n=1 Tax=Escherichia coli TaxID=562 RepID=A0A3L0VX69_ECOLX|nr:MULTISPECIES: hypothetical protein [Aeromonas]MBE8745281.1 hypothetical protein [Aeromonas veronii]MCX4116303.1 hypothetical protein [Aeromonas hydrophila]MDN6867333.1 hypothetical protein [Aeromonas caviae]MDU7313222.1 hypothetical protein [Aeromonas sp.]
MHSWELLSLLKRLWGYSYQDIASIVGVHRSNLSTFVNKAGKVKSVSQENITSALSFLGVSDEGVMLPIVHNWTLTSELLSEDEGLLLQLRALLNANKFVDVRYYRSLGGVFYVAGVSSLGPRFLIQLPRMDFDSVEQILANLEATPGYQTDLDAELYELRLQPSKYLFDRIFYWLSQRVVDDFLEKNEVTHV